MNVSLHLASPSNYTSFWLQLYQLQTVIVTANTYVDFFFSDVCSGYGVPSYEQYEFLDETAASKAFSLVEAGADPVPVGPVAIHTKVSISWSTCPLYQ